MATSSDILDVNLTVTKGSEESAPVYASIAITLSDNFDAPAIQVNLNNVSDDRLYGDRESEQIWVTLTRGEGGVYSATVELSPYSPTATYQLKALSAVDVSGQTLFFDQNQNFLDLGFTSSQFLFANPFSDSSAPRIENVEFSEWYKGEDGSWRIDVSLDAYDDISGIDFSENQFFAALYGPSDPHGWVTFDTISNPGGLYHGTGTIVANQYAPSGEYAFAIRLEDTALNSYWQIRGSYDDQAYSVHLENPEQDITPPELTSIDLVGGFDPSTGRPVIYVSGTIADDLSGFQLASFSLAFASDGSNRMVHTIGYNQSEYWNAETSSFFVPLTLPLPFEDGLYYLNGSMVDNARNDVWSETPIMEVRIIAPSPDDPAGTIEGTLNSELIFGSQDNDTITAREGDDYVVAGAGADYVLGGTGNDILVGGKGTDTLVAGDGSDVVKGGGGDDLIVGGDGAGDDAYKGGNGMDTVKYASATVKVIADLTQGSAHGTEIGSDTLSGIENVIGGAGNDVIIGDETANSVKGKSGNDKLSGKDGDDALAGAKGDDVLKGGEGNDQLSGGGGEDTYVFNTLPGSRNIDVIANYKTAEDTIKLDDDVFAALATGGKYRLSAGQFESNSTGTASGADARIIYNVETGALYYDPDGSGTAEAVQFALLAGTPVLSAGDFLVVG